MKQVEGTTTGSTTYHDCFRHYVVAVTTGVDSSSSASKTLSCPLQPLEGRTRDSKLIGSTECVLLQ